MKNEYLSFQTRTVALPELASLFRVATISVPFFLNDLLPESNDTSGNSQLEIGLSGYCQNIFSVPWPNVLSFTRWRDIAYELKTIIDSKDFINQISQVYGGNEESKLICEEIEIKRDKLSQLLNRFNTVNAYYESLMRNGIINVNKSFVKPSINDSPFGYHGTSTIIQSVNWELLERGIKELEIIAWNQITSILTEPVIPTGKKIFDEIGEYEIPISGSPGIKGLSLKSFEQYVRGAAFMVLGAAATTAGSAFSTGNWATVLACVIGGPFACIAFLSTIPIAKYIEDKILSTKRPRKEKENTSTQSS